MQKIKLAIFASGTGSNARKVMEFAQGKEDLEVAVIITNNPNAGILQQAKHFSCPARVLEKPKLIAGTECLLELRKHEVNFIALAGYLLKVPENLIAKYSKRIVNLHPALLPKYGGKGMYGERVHQAVLENGETESGITIHFVNEHYDEGAIIAQFTCLVTKNDTIETLVTKIHALEHNHFAPTIYETAKTVLAG